MSLEMFDSAGTCIGIIPSSQKQHRSADQTMLMHRLICASVV